MKKSRLVVIGIVLGALLGLTCLVGLSVWTMTGFAESAAKAPREWRQWEANGLPMTRDQVLLGPEVAKEDSIKDIFRETAVMERTGERAPWVPFHTEASWHDGTRAKFLASRQDILEKLILASEKKGVRLETNWDRPSPLIYRDEGLFEDVRWLSDDAVLRADTDWRESTRRLRAARRLAFIESQIPADGSLWTACYLDEDINDAVGLCASKWAGNPEALHALRQVLEETQWEPDPVPMLRAQAYEALRKFRLYGNQQIIDFGRGQNEPWEMFRRHPREGLPTALLSKAVFAEIMAFWNEFYPLMKSPGADFDRLAIDMATRATALETSQSVPQRIASQNLPVFSSPTFLAMKHQLAKQDLALAFVRVLEWRATHGVWPSDLKAVGMDAADAFSGKPFHYRSSASSARIWSVGPDGRDSGGMSDWEVRNLKKRPASYSDDRAFVYPWPPRPKR